ncbi:PilN domain-containing protein, partial [Vibrio parahaemolyticus]
MNDIRSCTPHETKIDALSLDGQTIKIEGEAADFTNVSDFA